MKLKRTLSLLLLTSQLILTISCGNDAEIPKTTDTDQSDVPTTETKDEREAVSDDLPQKNYNGDTFTIATDLGNEWMVLSEDDGDIVNEAIYKRNLAIEERFGVKLAYVSDEYAAILSKVANMVAADEDDVDLCMTQVVQSGLEAQKGVFMNWYDIPNVDFAKPWWSDSTVDDLTVNGTCLLAIGDFALSALKNTYCVFFNHKLASDYGIEDLYGMTNDGKWTIDKVCELSKNVYSDLNTNGEVDGEDRFGYITTVRSALNAYLWSFGGKVLSKDQDGSINLVYHTEKTSEMVTKLCSVFFDNEGIYNNSKEPEYSSLFAINSFSQGNALFVNGTIGQAVSQLRSMEDAYGILPYPKWDENQKDYYTMVDGAHHALCVPITVSDPERVGIITEALCAESYKKVVPAYYETALKVKYTRDDESVAMLDKIVASRVFDLGYVYDGWKGASFIFQELISANNPNFESTWAKREKTVSAYYDSVIEYLENYGK